MVQVVAHFAELAEQVEYALQLRHVAQEGSAGWTSVAQTYLFTNDDIDVILEQAYARRRSTR